MKKIEEGILKEKEDWRAELKAELDPMKDQIQTLHDGISEQTKNWLAKEQNILAAMQDGNQKVAEWLELEWNEREKQKEML